MHFPRFSLAPSIGSKVRRRSPADTSDSGPRMDSVLHPGGRTASPIGNFRQDALADRMRSIAAIGNREAVPTVRLGTKATTQRLLRVPPEQRLPPHLATRLVLRETLARPIGVRPGADLQKPIARKGPLPVLDSGYVPSGSARSSALAPLATRSLQGLPNLQRAQARRPDLHQTNDLSHPNDLFQPKDLSRREGLVPYDSRADPKQRASADQETRLTGRDADATSDPPRSKSAISTIHIDGSALGRWTVQHLERALSKPATGITGVDPRAAVPRTRIAPF